MASASGRPPPMTEPSILDEGENAELQFLRKLEWVRNRRKEVEIAILYEKKKQGITEVDAAGNNIPDDFDIVQPKLEAAINKSAMLNTILKELQISDTLEKFMCMSMEDRESLRNRPQEIDNPLEDLMDGNLQTSKKIAQIHNDINELIKENIGKQLMLSKMSQERHLLMQSYWKKKKRDEEFRRGSAGERIKRLEKKVSLMKKVLTVNNHVLQLVAGSSGIDWSKDRNLLPIILECGKPIEQQLQNVA